MSAKILMPHHTTNTQSRQTQRGASLIMVMLILVVVSVLGIGSVQIALMSERGARNDRDQQMAWQAAEAAIIEAEFDINDITATRSSLFNGNMSSEFIPGCGTSGQSTGLCGETKTGKPAWLTVNFTSTGPAAQTTAFGAFSSHTFAAGGVGIQPAQTPRYIIELVQDTIGDMSEPTFLYRVTAIGFGPRADIQAMIQMLYRK